MNRLAILAIAGILLPACSQQATQANSEPSSQASSAAQSAPQTESQAPNKPENQTANQPSFDCNGDRLSSIEVLVCQDSELAALDRQLAEVYQAASAKAINEQPPLLKAEQRGWIKGRDECWKSDDKHSCAFDNYRMRIAELQARYRLIAPSAEVSYQCDGIAAKEVVVSYFATEPATLIAEFGDSVSLMYSQPSGSGSRYQGRNESLWEHQGEARITWGYGAEPMICKLAD
ncbi:MliC family protein [Shewanella alkalitolerans]|uniref:MliC family protein n=1 Tax=Shewanella alkalitolerans TaxID=2864209 RepID=UPI001C65A31D|nr:MliC family protein [Shewanella alkalitolerans]QYJ97213.1 MliC family protein [Shewanella alkalitolerans]